MPVKTYETDQRSINFLRHAFWQGAEHETLQRWFNEGKTADDVSFGDDIVSQADVASLNMTITDPPTQAEVQAIADKVDELLTTLRNANVLTVA